MTIHTVLKIPNRLLTTRTEQVTEFDEKLEELVSDMIETASANGLIGMAANQIGILQSIFVVKVITEKEEEGQSHFMAFVNPIVRVIRENGKDFVWEGCGSIPNINCLVERWKTVKIVAQTAKGDPCDMEVSGHMARTIQHENDHLNAILITSKARQIKRL